VLAQGQTDPIAVAVNSGYVYWTLPGTNGAVMKMPTSGGTPVAVAANQNGPWGVAVDEPSVYGRNRQATSCIPALTTFPYHPPLPARRPTWACPTEGSVATSRYANMEETMKVRGTSPSESGNCPFTD
jgi:hypothetical protein